MGVPQQSWGFTLEIIFLELVHTGINSTIYKFQINGEAYKIKISKIDFYQRTLREKDALELLSKLQVPLYASPLFWTIDEQSKVGILVTKWVNGHRLQLAGNNTIIKIISFLTKIHDITLNNCDTIKKDCWGASSIYEMKACIDYQLQFLNKKNICKYERYLSYFFSCSKPDNPYAYRCLCHMDNNFSNFIDVNNTIFALDWEYSGVSDPAFDLAQFITHPSICLNSDFDYLEVLSHYNNLSTSIIIDYEWYEYLFSSMTLWWSLHIEKYLQSFPQYFSKTNMSFKSQSDLLYQRDKYYEKLDDLKFS